MQQPSSDYLCCPVSQDPYAQAGPRRPRILPCGHSVSHVSLAAILRQASESSRRCPICRQQLQNTYATTYPLNIALLELLESSEAANNEGASDTFAHAASADPTAASHAHISPITTPHTTPGRSPVAGDASPTREPGPPPPPAQSHAHPPVDVSDEEAAAAASKAAAALFPGQQWLAQRGSVNLAAVGLLPALRAGRGMVPVLVWGRVVAKYRLPGALVKQLDDGVEEEGTLLVRASQGGGGREGATEAAELSDGNEPLKPLLAVHFHRLRTPRPAADSPPPAAADDDPPAGEHAQLSRAEVHQAVLPHIVPQLLPSVSQHVLPLLGFYVQSAAAAGSAPAATPQRRGADRGEARVGLVYADIGESLQQNFLSSPAQGARAQYTLAISILTDLATLLCMLHSISLPAERVCPLWPSSIRLPSTSPCPLASTVRLAPPAHDLSSGSLCRAALPQCLLDADELCTPDPGTAARAARHAQHAEVQLQMAADVWRLGALGTVLMTACGRGADAAPRIARAGTAHELLAEMEAEGRFTDAHPFLQACLHEDASQRCSAPAALDALGRLPRLDAARLSMLRPPALQLLRRPSASASGDDDAVHAAAPHPAAPRGLWGGTRTHTRVLTGRRDRGGEEEDGEARAQQAGEDAAARRGKCQMSATVRACSCGVVLCFVMCTLGRLVTL